jgi:hypothetical protein
VAGDIGPEGAPGRRLGLGQGLESGVADGSQSGIGLPTIEEGTEGAAGTGPASRCSRSSAVSHCKAWARRRAEVGEGRESAEATDAWTQAMAALVRKPEASSATDGSASYAASNQAAASDQRRVCNAQVASPRRSAAPRA